MSMNPSDYSAYSRSGRRSSQQVRQDLPPIRDVVGDVLEQPARPRASPGSQEADYPKRQTYPTYSTSTQDLRYKNYSEQYSHSAVQLPPVRSRFTYPNSPRASSTQAPSGDGSRTHPAQGPSSGYPQAKTVRPDSSRLSSHSYDVFVASSEGLVHQRSSSRDDFRQLSKEEAISSSTGRHSCPECGRRFEKLSHFKNHLTSHSGEKPYDCPWPGCGKKFSASSNMRRHHRTHAPDDFCESQNT